MFRTQLNITHHIKNQDHLNCKGKRWSTDANTGMTQMLELSDKNFKVTVIKILHQAIVNTFETKYRKSQQIKRRHKEEPNGF